MKKIGKFLLRLMAVLVLLGVVMWFVGPYEDADLRASFDDSVLDQGVEGYLAQQESRFDDITEGVQKQVLWAGEAEAKTDWVVLYVHGFSATAQEIRPVPDEVAAGLEANLIYTRLQGHGRGSAAMAEATVSGWMTDIAEGLAIARRLGNRVLVVTTSTGGTLAAAAAVDKALMQDVAGIVLVSPNFGINNPVGPLLTWPAARYWMPIVAGKTRAFEPKNELQGKYWTTTYPSVAVLPMAALVKAVDGLDLGQAKVPALFIFTDADQVVRAELTRDALAEWGGPTEVVNPTLGPTDDPVSHVIAGDILSPNQNAPTVEAILNWAKGL